MVKQAKPLKNAQEIIDRAKELGKVNLLKIGVAAANDRDVLAAVVEARKERIVEPLLVGEKDKINSIADEYSLDIDGIEIIDIEGESQAAHMTAQLAHEGEIQLLMKGFLQTTTLMKTVLNPRYKLKLQPTVSSSAVMTVPGYHKLINITDGSMISEPNLDQKIGIIRNAILTAKALGIIRPKIALHSCTDVVDLSIKSTVDNSILTQMARRGQFGEVEIDGPLTLDVAMKQESAEYIGIPSPVAGDADALIVSSMDEGNIIGKGFVTYGGATYSGIVVGAKVPISLVSRADSTLGKKSSIALGVILADYISKNLN